MTQILWSGREYALSVMIFIGMACFLTVKGWFNTAIFILFVYVLTLLFTKPKFFFQSRCWQTWGLFCCLVAPLLLELCAQLGRGEVIIASLDGPSRWLISAIIFLCFSKFNNKQMFQAVGYGSAVGILVLGLSLTIFSEQYWGSRAATYFADPITMSCYIVAQLAMFLGVSLSNKFTSARAALEISVIVAVLLIVLDSESRSSWVPFIAVTVGYVGLRCFNSKAEKLALIVILSFSIGAVCITSADFVSRIHEALKGYAAYVDVKDVAVGENTEGDLEPQVVEMAQNSVSHRLFLASIDFEILKKNPYFGTTDAEIPSYEELTRDIPNLSRSIYEIRLLAGSHSEFLAILTTQGYIFGIFTIVCMFILPIYLGIYCLINNRSSDSREISPYILAIIGIATAGIGIQISNLKMTEMFFAVTVALLYITLCKLSRLE